MRNRFQTWPALLMRSRRITPVEAVGLSINVLVFIAGQVVLRTVSSTWGWVMIAISSLGLALLTMANGYKRLGEITRTSTSRDDEL